MQYRTTKDNTTVWVLQNNPTDSRRGGNLSNTAMMVESDSDIDFPASDGEDSDDSSDDDSYMFHDAQSTKSMMTSPSSSSSAAGRIMNNVSEKRNISSTYNHLNNSRRSGSRVHQHRYGIV